MPAFTTRFNACRLIANGDAELSGAALTSGSNGQLLSVANASGRKKFQLLDIVSLS